MSENTTDYTEDEQILACLSDPLDVEAFSNLMNHAHELGMSAADLVREEPKRTSRKIIQKLCLKNRKQRMRVQILSILRNLWGKPVLDPKESFPYLPFGKPGTALRNGAIRG